MTADHIGWVAPFPTGHDDRQDVLTESRLVCRARTPRPPEELVLIDGSPIWQGDVAPRRLALRHSAEWENHMTTEEEPM